MAVDDKIKPHILCKECGARKIGRLQLIWCNECAFIKENTKNG